jgi:mannose-1-phosphate guanylyltransferase
MKLIVAKGLNDFIVIDEEDVLLIYPRDDEQEIKEVRNSLRYPNIK